MTKIRVRIGQAEAEVEADQEHLREAIEMVPELASKLGTAPQATTFGVPKEPFAAQGQLSATGPSGLPSVTIEKGDSLAEVIAKFFADPWGRERRKLLDVREALQSYGLNYPKQSVAVALLRLAKTTKIRRFKADDGEFVYTAGTLTASLAPPQLEEVELESASEKLI